MTRCVLGANPEDYAEGPPCQACINQSIKIQSSAPTHWFTYTENMELSRSLLGLGLDELYDFRWEISELGLSFDGLSLPFGEIVLPSIRWAFRRHHLSDDISTISIFKEFIKSAYQVALSFAGLLDRVDTHAVVVFNGIMFPEAIARLIAESQGIRVITHEVGFQPLSVFLTNGQATAYPMDLPVSFELTEKENQQLDNYLNRRFKGDFTMAGIRFWPKMDGLNEDFFDLMKSYKQVVTVFTNVINDTSQVHASTVFSHMFDWLETVLEVIKIHKDTLFVIRAHPDEKRRGTRKHSKEPVSDWVDETGVSLLPNVLFFDSDESVSSYELIGISKFIIVYNSSIGLEAALLGIPVLCGGKARYTQYPIVYFPQSASEFQSKAASLLSLDKVDIPESFQKNARRLLYWQLFRASIPLEEYLYPHLTPGYVQLKDFSWQELCVGHSIPIRTIVEGIVKGNPFLLPA
jgi:hypothetical protein